METQYTLIDTHSHLQMKTFKKDIDIVIERAISLGIKIIINIGYDIPSSEGAVKLAQKYPFMYAVVGIHPHEAKTYNDATLSILDDFLKDDKVIGIGEIGLDYYRDISPREIQIKVFREQLDFAMGKKIPVVLHIRDAYSDIFEILKEKPFSNILLHCFSGNKGEAREGIKRGYYFSFAGNITYNPEYYSDVIEAIPLERIVLETDAPFLSPVPYRGKRNEPSFIKFTAERMAQVKKVAIEKLGEITTNNAIEFFQLDSK